MNYSEKCRNEIITILETELERHAIDEVNYRVFLINQIEKFNPPVWINGKCQKRNELPLPIGPGTKAKLQKKLQLCYLANWKYNQSILDETRNRLDSLIGALYKQIGKNYIKINRFYEKYPRV
jgi:hypothetical protein